MILFHAGGSAGGCSDGSASSGLICDALTKLETPEDHIIRLPISAPDRLDLESKSEEAQAVEEQLKNWSIRVLRFTARTLQR